MGVRERVQDGFALFEPGKQQNEQYGTESVDRAVGTKEKPTVGKAPLIDDDFQKDLIAPSNNGVQDKVEKQLPEFCHNIPLFPVFLLF